ncbi:hypothetical protein TCAL_06037 [Tigriopus californicus]|uniref:Uncharacterized protein n=1 Tax=Tigriopus californicus TaxID=6832 RepID=A0A553P6L5_TIGCA|nr:hypothetical protein TCAL_06037 [Tigriopus californicus]
MAEEVAPTTSLSGSGSGSSSGSDNESWIILDQVEDIPDQEIVSEQPDRPPLAGSPHSNSGRVSRNQEECCSDSEPEDRSSLLTKLTHISNLSAFTYNSDGPESVCSDGIPISEDLLSEEKSSQYLWNSEIASDDLIEESVEVRENPDETQVMNLLGQMNPQLNISQLTLKQHDLDEEDEDEREDSIFAEDASDIDFDEDIEIIPPRSFCSTSSDLSTLYPSNELPESYPNIKRGQTYSHKRKDNVNYVLTGLLIGFMVLVMGLGIGHFLGWSERLELQEYYADIREERLEALEDNLVSCMTGPEGQGQDDQDLDDKVIRQLWEENKELKAQLEQLKNEQDQAYESSDKVEEELSAILRDRLNDLLTANADLEKEVARLRYSHGAMVEVEDSKAKLEESAIHLKSTKANLNSMVHENDQLRLAIGKARYGTPSVPVRRMRYSMPQGLGLNSPSKNEEISAQDNATFVDEGFIEIEDDDQEYEGTSEKVSVLDSFSDLVFNTTQEFFGFQSKDFNLSVASDMLQSFNDKVHKVWDEALASSEDDLTEFKDMTKQLEKMLEDKWMELLSLAQDEEVQKQADNARKTLSKLSKTLFETLKYAEESVTSNADVQDWLGSLAQIQAGLNKKWNGILDKFHNKKQRRGDMAEGESDSLANKASSRWSSKNTDWTFERAKTRKEARQAERRSDWLFERAQNRKRFHEFEAVDWHSKRMLNKWCDEEDECHTLSELNPSSVNHGKQSKKRGDEFTFSGDSKQKTIFQGKKKSKKRQFDESKIIDINEDLYTIRDGGKEPQKHKKSSWKKSRHDQKKPHFKRSHGYESYTPKVF